MSFPRGAKETNPVIGRATADSLILASGGPITISLKVDPCIASHVNQIQALVQRPEFGVRIEKPVSR